MDTFFLGPLGSMQPVEVSKNMPISTQRGSSELITSGGVRYVQQGRRAPRSWVFSHNWQDPYWARFLTAAAHGLMDECWLYDVATARENMVPASLAVGSGIKLPTDGIPVGSLAPGHSVTVPVLAGRLYTVSGWCSAPVGSNVMTYQMAGGSVEYVKASPGESHRQSTGTIRTTTDGLLTVTLLVVGTTGLRVHEGAPDGRFYTGYGTPCRVAVQDPERTLRLVSQDMTRSDYQVTLLEVGKPGTI